MTDVASVHFKTCNLKMTKYNLCFGFFLAEQCHDYLDCATARPDSGRSRLQGTSPMNNQYGFLFRLRSADQCDSPDQTTRQLNRPGRLLR